MNAINSKEYWDKRFQSQDWRVFCGPEQTKYFTELFVQNAPQWLIRYVRQNNLSVLDLGCAEGEGTKVLDSVWPQQVSGADFSAAAIAQAQQKYSDLSYEVQDIFQLTKDWDVIYLSNVVEHFEAPYSAISAVCKHARRAVIIMVPFEETAEISEHVAKFTFDSIPMAIDDFQLVYHNDIMKYNKDEAYYFGQQMILVYAKDPELQQTISLGQSSGLIENWASSEDYSEFKARFYSLDAEYGLASNRMKAMNDELYEAKVRLDELRNVGVRNEELIRENTAAHIRIEALTGENAQVKQRNEELTQQKLAADEQNQALEQQVSSLTAQLQESTDKYTNLYAYSCSRDLELVGIKNCRSYRALRKVQNSFIYRAVKKVLQKTIRMGKALFTLNFRALAEEFKDPIRYAYLRIKAPLMERKVLAQLKLATRNKDIIVFPPTIDWHMPLYQRPQQLAGAYSRKKNVAVIYITQNLKHDHVAVAEKINNNLWIISESYAKRLPELTQNANSVALSISWTLNKHYLDIVKPDKVIYEYIDELEIFGGYGPQMEEDHLRFLKEADVTVCTATKLYNQAAHLAKNPILSPNAGDYEFFAKTDSYEINPLIRDIIKPYKCVIGYYGALANWFDYEMVKTVAALHPEWLFLLVGVDYDGTIHKSGVLDFENIVYIPPQPYTELPTFLKAFDVASIPFVINEITLSTSPVKLFEYMAGGKPIIASKMPECLKYESVKTYETVEEFCRIIETYQNMERDDEYWNVLEKDALDNTWDARTDEIIQALN